MIQTGSNIGYALNLGNAGGNAEAAVKATLKGDGSQSGRDLLVSPNATLGDLISAMKLEFSLDAPDEALALTPAAMFLDPAMLAPWVLSDGRGLTGNLVLEDLVIDANGQGTGTRGDGR